ncbi:GNAT family N-acetyltransferase [Mesobacillus maritimus]|jgi:RimJ/RimL family protein N-acetyltransferase|uniref:GNAT family N-acetyltransferase n=1 Tax=Mesobacillus maritimus TaxID=1643336 RepID=A0ABS7K026_9BACI|nr:GNAT family protein [Mesobacillus maritimus]MBY0095576.1 GNAT family N-acetyltransferase [Mesobacillus maritimus]
MIALRYFEPPDFQTLIQWVDSPAFLLQWAGSSFYYPLTEAQLEDYVRDANQGGSTKLIYCVVHNEKDKVIGHISLTKIDHRNKSARIGRVLVGDERYRGQGLGELMIQEMLKIAFNELKLHRVTLGVFDFNSGAIACYEKAGFTKEGLFRDTLKHNDTYWSQWEMSILEEEWREHKQ